MDDLISRQAAIDAVCKACMLEREYHTCEGYREDSEWCEEITALRKLPSAQPEQRWIDAIREVIKCSGSDGFIIVPKDGTEGWDENGVHYMMQPEKKTGKWIEEPNCFYRCTLCGEHFPSIRGYMYYNFCPNCGSFNGGQNEKAEMREET